MSNIKIIDNVCVNLDLVINIYISRKLKIVFQFSSNEAEGNKVYTTPKEALERIKKILEKQNGNDIEI